MNVSNSSGVCFVFRECFSYHTKLVWFVYDSLLWNKETGWITGAAAEDQVICQFLVHFREKENQ